MPVKTLEIFKLSAVWFSIWLLNYLCLAPMFGFEFAAADVGERLYHVKQAGIGRVPYRDFFCHHFLGYLAPFAIIDRIFNLTPTSLWNVALVYNFLTAIILYHLCKHLTQSKTIGLLAAIGTVTFGWFPNWGGLTFNNQSYFLPLLALFLLFSGRKRIDAASFVLGLLCTFDIRLTAFALILIPLLMERKEYKTLQRCIISFTAPILVALLYLSTTGALEQFVFQTLVYPFTYKSAGMGEHYSGAALLLLSWMPRGEPLPVLLALCGLVFLYRSKDHEVFRQCILAGLIACVFYTVAAGRDRPNYLLVFAPFIIVLATLSVHYLKWLGALFVLSALLVVRYPLVQYLASGQLEFEVDERVIKEAAKYIKSSSRPNDRILIWGYAPSIYVLSDRFTDFRDASLLSVAGSNFHSYDSSQSIIPEMVREFKRGLNQNPPKFFVYYYIKKESLSPSPTALPFDIDSSKTFPLLNMDYERVENLKFLRKFIKIRYELEKSVDGHADGAHIYRLRR